MAKAIEKARNWVNKNTSIVCIAAGVLLVVSLGAVASSIVGGARVPGPVEVYYYDLETGELFLGMSDQYPPIHTPSSDGTGRPMGARAYVFTCSDCSDEESRFVGYLEMYSPEAKKMFENPPDFDNPDDPGAVDRFMIIEEEGHLIRGLDSELWVLELSDEGMTLIEELQTRCGENKIPQPCLPNS